jgi:hypothetical protein
MMRQGKSEQWIYRCQVGGGATENGHMERIHHY